MNNLSWESLSNNMAQWVEATLPNAWNIRDEFFTATMETLYMLIISMVIGCLLGLVIGVILTVTHENGILENKPIYRILDAFVNVFRSIPFIILLAFLINVTRFIVSKTTGPTAATIPIIASTIPFYARQVENALLEVNGGVIEAAEAMGLSYGDIIFKVYLREGFVTILRATASTTINVLGLTAMAGTVGGGGLGTVAIARGYQRSRFDVILVSTLLILLIVFLSQVIFNFMIRRANKYQS